jgi:DNA-binding PucR family transcriptional regulator
MVGTVPDPLVRQLLERAALTAIERMPRWLDELDGATLAAHGMEPIAVDPELSAAANRATKSNITCWLTAQIANPGMPVAANTSAELLADARNMVRRGVDRAGVDAYRTGQQAAWLRWMQIVFELGADLETTRELLDLTSRSIASFLDATIEVVDAVMEDERRHSSTNAHSEKRAFVEDIISGDRVVADTVERTLAYGLSATHTAAVVWTTDPRPDAVALRRVAQNMLAGRAAQLVVVASAGTLWTWTSGDMIPAPAAAIPDGVHVAIGSPAYGIEGFRQSHLEALEVQRMLSRIGSRRRVASAREVSLVNLATTDPATAFAFVQTTLGALAEADHELQETLRVYLRMGSAAHRAATVLHAHRNTVVRRVERAVALLPRPLPEASTEVSVALDILHWHG